ncbi:cytochrome P450 oxidoreductase, partial [Aureobasidium melanogenum]
MVLLSLIGTASLTSIILVGLCFGATILTFYRLFKHPITKIPGPTICCLTSLWMHYHIYIGDEATRITELHKIYGPVVRVAPNEVCIADGAAIAPIYVEKGGFPKAECYRNFDIDGFASLFSETFKQIRAPKAKSVMPLFSTTNIRKSEQLLTAAVGQFVARLRRERSKSILVDGNVDILVLTRGLAIDAVSSYLFGKSYGALDEDVEQRSAKSTDGKSNLSAGKFVDAFVGVGRFFYLPNWIFLLIELLSEKLYGTQETEESMSNVDRFVTGVVKEAQGGDGSFPGCMLQAGLTPKEVAAQCKDLLFAGTDSTGMNLATFCWQLARNPDVYMVLRSEITDAHAKNPSGFDPMTLPYLRACVREALRLSMANPTRLPRVVPSLGWTFHSEGQAHHFPAGTIVSVQMLTLHHNPTIFKDPYLFRPERWLDTPKEALQLMLRDFIPFGAGSRQCIARNLATLELTLAGEALIADGVLEGARVVHDKLNLIEWFNSHVEGDSILLNWQPDNSKQCL